MKPIKTFLLATCVFAVLLAIPRNSCADNLYVANGNYAIDEFNSSGVGTVFASTGTSLPESLAFDTSGNLYVLLVGNNGNGNYSIDEFNSSGVGTPFASSGLDNPRGLAFDSVGNLYIANLGSRTIEKFNSSGIGTVFASGSDFNVVGLNASPQALAFDGAGNLYVAADNSIMKFNPSGVGTIFTSSLLSNPTSLAFASAGNLYAANYSFNTIEEFNSSGEGSVFASPSSNPGLADPAALAFQPVPEPSTWTMLAGGMIALFSVKRHRA